MELYDQVEGFPAILHIHRSQSGWGWGRHLSSEDSQGRAFIFKSLGVSPGGKDLGIVSMSVLGDVHQPRSDLHT